MNSIQTSSIKKNRIDLSCYNYKRDVQHRIAMSHFNTSDVVVLNEILNGSLNISIKTIARHVDLEELEIVSALEKLSNIGLIARHGQEILVDKELRKYYEVQIARFEEDFEPDIDFIFQVLKKVPIHVLPVWYAVPKHADNIFQSIIERFLSTPTVFNRYLNELNLEDEFLQNIVHDIFNHPQRKISAKEIKKKYNLSEEDFATYMLYLEYHFLCSSYFVPVGSEWQEVVCAFREWREYTEFLEKTFCSSIEEESNIVSDWPTFTLFSEGISEIIQLVLSNTQNVEIDDQYNVPEPVAQTLQTSLIKKYESLRSWGDEAFRLFFRRNVQKLLALKLGEVQSGKLCILQQGLSWIELSFEDQCLYLYRHPLNKLSPRSVKPELCIDRNIREVEKSLKRVISLGWVFFDEFAKGLSISIGSSEGVHLAKQGSRWFYKVPKYTEEEICFVKSIVFERLQETGFILAGHYQDRACFKVTPLGKSIL